MDIIKINLNKKCLFKCVFVMSLHKFKNISLTKHKNLDLQQNINKKKTFLILLQNQNHVKPVNLRKFDTYSLNKMYTRVTNTT